MPNFFYEVHFYLFGLIAIASAIAFVTRKSPVAAALWLVNTMFSLAALYAMLEAHFISVIQVLVYAGAIMDRIGRPKLHPIQPGVRFSRGFRSGPCP